jgi:hypothetical protein
VATDAEATRRAVAFALELSETTQSDVILLVPRRPGAGGRDALEGFRKDPHLALGLNCGISAVVFGTDERPEEFIRAQVHPASLVIIGGQPGNRRPTRAGRIATALASLGYRVEFVPLGGGKTPRMA